MLTYIYKYMIWTLMSIIFYKRMHQIKSRYGKALQPSPSHTTRHAGPYRAVYAVVVFSSY